MSDELSKWAAEITNGVTAENNRKLLRRVAYLVADAVQEHRTPELEGLKYALEKAGLRIESVWCEGFTVYGEECTLPKHHTGDCA